MLLLLLVIAPIIQPVSIIQPISCNATRSRS
jgi:hypothetical protein